MLRWATTMLTGVLLLAGATLAAAVPEKPDAKAIAPYVGAQTLAVVHIDTAGIDLKQAKQAALDVLAAVKLPEADRREVEKGMDDAIQAASALIAQFRAAGGRHIWLITALQDFPRSPGVLVAPAGKPADVQALVKFFSGMDAARVQVRDGAVVFADKEVVDRALAQGGKARPELAEALAAVGALPAQGIFLPTEDLRRVVESLVEKLPKQLGGGPVTPVTRGLSWAAAGATAGPKPAGRLIVQAADEKTAKALQDVVRTGLDSFMAETGMKAQQAELIRLILPKQENARLILDVGREELTALANLTTPPLAAARARARRVQSASNIRQILQGCYLHGNERKGAWPDDLQTLAKTTDLHPQVLIDPTRLAPTPYVYLKPATPQDKTGPDVIVVHETLEGAAGGVNVGFADGHVEFMALKAFEEAIARQKAAR